MDCPRARARTAWMIWPELQARAISFWRSRPWPKGSQYTLIVPEAKVTIAFSALNSCSVTMRWISMFEWQLVALACTWKLTAICIFYWLMIRGVINKFVSFFHRIIIYVWIYIIFCHYQQQSAINRKKTLKCKVRQTCDVSMTLMTSHVGDVVVKTLEDRCGWCTLSGYKCYSISAIILKFEDNICT